MAFGKLGNARGGKRVPQSRSRRGGRRDEARAVTRAFTAMIASIPSVDPHRGPVDLSYAAEAREEKPMLPGGKISISPRNVSARRSARGNEGEARAGRLPRADAAAGRPSVWPPEKYDDDCRVPKLREEYFEHDQGEGTRSVLVALTEGTRARLAGEACRFSFFSFFVFPETL